MKIDNLKLQDFRNITELSIRCHPNMNVIWGKNGQGKTNVLEAISCLSLGKSFRVTGDKPLIQFTKPLFYIEADGETNKGNLKVSMAYNGSKKRSKVNGVDKKRLVDFIGNLQTVSFSPDDLSIIKEGRSERRKFIDTMLCQISNRYCINLATYQKIVEQRNKLLRDRPPQLRELLKAWNFQLVQYAADIWLMRYRTVKQIEELGVEFFREVTGSDFNISLVFKPEVNDELFEITEETTKEELANLLLQVFEDNFEYERRRGHTLFGPHRDDLVILINNMDSKIYASQGQQRLISLSLRMAELHYIEEFVGESPILLLDDIFSELDEEKIENIMTILTNKDRQIFITTTERMDLPLEFESWYMEDGIIRKDLHNK